MKWKKSIEDQKIGNFFKINKNKYPVILNTKEKGDINNPRNE